MTKEALENTVATGKISGRRGRENANRNDAVWYKTAAWRNITKRIDPEHQVLRSIERH